MLLPPPAPLDPAATERARRPVLLTVEAILVDLRVRRARLARAAGSENGAERGAETGTVLADVDALIDWAVALREALGGAGRGVRGHGLERGPVHGLERGSAADGPRPGGDARPAEPAAMTA